MPSKPPTFHPSGRGAKQREADYEVRRRREQPWRKKYYTTRWYALRDRQLTKQPLCEHCLQSNPSRITAATVVHHKTPHRGDDALFYDPNNLESACQPCHDGPLQSAERTRPGGRFSLA